MVELVHVRDRGGERTSYHGFWNFAKIGPQILVSDPVSDGAGSGSGQDKALIRVEYTRAVAVGRQRVYGGNWRISNSMSLVMGHCRISPGDRMKLRGVIQKGVGQGSFFTSLPWVKEQFQKAMGFAPYPGTVNVRISEEDLSQMDDFFSTKDFEIVPTDPKFCAGSFKKVQINGILGAAVFPGEDVRVHGKEIIEIVCGCHLKDTLRLKDGDPVLITDFHDPSQRV